jgi:T5SS/PEP-CTERM-associated repeat protein
MTGNIIKRHNTWLICGSFARDNCLRATITLAILCPAVAQATNFSWVSTGGQFDAASNWTQSGFPSDRDRIPDADDAVTFDRGNVTLYPVYFGNLLAPNSDIHPTVDKVVIGNNPLSFVGLYGSTLTVDSTNTTETGRGVVIGSGAGDVAVLTSSLATFDTQYATLGSAAGSNGTLNLTSSSVGAFSVSGTGATYDLIVGLNGTGMINVSNGRDVTVADHTVIGQNATGVGHISISGAGSTWTNTGDLTVGLAGSGSLSLSAAALLTSAVGILGSSTGSNGLATITGAGTVWSGAASFYVGYSGNGTLDLTSGGDVIAGNGYIGFNGGSTGVVNVSTGGGNQSRWVQSTDLYVGHTGMGTLNITAGGFAQSDTTFIGHSMLGDGKVIVSGADSYWTCLGNVYVGNSGAGAVGINSGARAVNGTTYIGNIGGSTGEALVTGANSEWEISGGNLYVGNAGTGTLTVSNSGKVHSNGDLYVGKAGNGTLNVTAGGAVENMGGFVGYESGWTGAVIVDGIESSWTNNARLLVGVFGEGTVAITNRGRVILSASNTGGGVTLGVLSGSTGVVTVDGASSLSFNPLSSSYKYHQLVIGGAGNGALKVTNGGAVYVKYDGFSVDASTTFDIASVVGSTGTVVVDGLYSQLIVDSYPGYGSTSIRVGVLGEGNLSVAHAGYVGSSHFLSVGPRGTLNITSGGWVYYVDGVLSKIGNDAATATVDGAGSRWDNINLSVGGILTVSNGGTVKATTLTVGTTGEVRGNGNITGNVVNNGNIAPGTSPGSLQIAGNYTQGANGKLLIELASPSSFDQLQVTDTATLAGTLVVNLLGGFTPNIGQSFTILTADDVDGTFSTQVFQSGTIGFEVIYNAQSVVLKAISALPGDYNGNGAVDAADYVVWRNNVGTATLNNRDPNGTGPVGQADYNFWRARFGNTIGSGAGASSSTNAAVPEPASVLMFLVGTLVIYTHRRTTLP